MKIGCDLDGVVSNFMLGFSELCNKHYGSPIITKKEEVTSWDLCPILGLTEEQVDRVFDEIGKSRSFWRTLKVWDRRNFNYFKQHFNGQQVYFITHRTFGENIFKQTVAWLDSIGWINPQVIVTTDKTSIIRDLKLDWFVDDRLETWEDIIDKARNCIPVIYDYPHNQKDGNYAHRVNNLREYTDMILKYTPYVF